MKKPKSKKKIKRAVVKKRAVAKRRPRSKPTPPSRSDFKAARKFPMPKPIKRHGIKRPRPNSGITERIWLLIEEITKKKGKAGICTRAEILTAAAKHKDMKPGTVSLNYCLWRKFMGYAGKRIASPHPRTGTGKPRKPAAARRVKATKPKLKAKAKPARKPAPKKKAATPAPKKPTPPKAPAAPKPPKTPPVLVVPAPVAPPAFAAPVSAPASV